MEPTLKVKESPKRDVQPGKKPYHRPCLRAAGRARNATRATWWGFVPDGVTTPTTYFTFTPWWS